MTAAPDYTGQVAAIIDALTIGHQQFYLVNADFHAAVTQLAVMLPAMVNGLADQAETDTRDRAMIERLIRTATTP